MDAELYELISETVNTRAKLDVLHYFHENPFAWESLDGLAQRLYRSPTDLEPALVALAREGLLRARASDRTSHEIIFSYQRDNPKGEALGRLLEAYGDAASREVIAAVSVADGETRAREMARKRELEDLRTRFVSMVSHELRTPVTAVRGTLAAIMSHEELYGPEVRPLLERAMAQCDRLASVVENLLVLSGVQTDGRLDLYLDEVDVPALVLAAVDELRREGMAREVACDLAEVPAVVADEYLLGQAVRELLSNAAKFSPPGSSIAVTARHDADFVRLAVTDEGVGIQPRSREQVFEAFYQSEGDSARRVAGLGLGLFMARLIAEQHGGGVEVEPSRGRGVTVTIRMPLAGPPTSG